MTVYLVILEERLLKRPNYKNIINDYILEVFDSEEKAVKFCQDISDKEHEDYIIKHYHKLEPYEDIIGDIEDNARYEVYIIERELK